MLFINSFKQENFDELEEFCDEKDIMKKESVLEKLLKKEKENREKNRKQKEIEEFYSNDKTIFYINLFSYLSEMKKEEKKAEEKKAETKEKEVVVIETIEKEMVDKIIEEKKIKDILRIDMFSTNAEDKEVWKFYRLFNDALIKVKYAVGFS